MIRRKFLENIGLASLATPLLVPGLGYASPRRPRPAASLTDASPSPAQRAWMDLGFGMFVHFGINTFYDKEWSDGTLDPQGFAPTQVDTDLWCRVAQQAGMKYIVLTAKHHDGFCLWPSAHSSYSVAQSPYAKDVVGQLAASAQKYGLKLGLYFSLWDRREPSFTQDWWAFVDIMMAQLEELMTQYGPVTELWLDGFWKKQSTGWSKKNTELEGEAAQEAHSDQRNLDFINAWRQEGAYWWQIDHLYRQVKSWQPDCMVMNNSTSAFRGVPLHPVDIRSGEKYTDAAADQKVWSWLGKEAYLPLQIETTMSTQGNEKFPTGNWFWHASDHSVRTKEEIHAFLKTAKAMEANLLLNVGVNDKGSLRPEDEAVLSTLRD